MSKETQTENIEKEPYFIFIGSTLPEEVKEVLDEKMFTVKKQMDEGQIRMIELTPEEMAKATEIRKNLKEDETVSEFISNEDKRKDAIDFSTRFRKSLEREGDKDGSGWYTKKDVKNTTSLSWSRFNNVLNTLKLFGLVDEENGYISFKVQEEDTQEVLIEKLQNSIEELSEQIMQARTVIKDSEVKKKLYNFKRKLSLKL